MSFAKMAAVLKSPEPKGSKRWVLFMLAYRYRDDRAMAWPSIKGPDGLGRQCGLEPRTIRRILRDLEADGWISICGKTRWGNQYKVWVPRRHQSTSPGGRGDNMSPPSERADNMPPRESPRGDGESARGDTESPPYPRHEEHPRHGHAPDLKTPSWVHPGTMVRVYWGDQWIERELVALEDAEGEPTGDVGFEHPKILGTYQKAANWLHCMRRVEPETA